MVLVIGGAGVVWIVRRRETAYFLRSKELVKQMKDQEEKHRENYVNEMRNMVANVAHDLKTVSFSIWSMKFIANL